MKLEDFMKYAVENKCSDLHLSAGEKPIVRRNGDLQRLDHSELSSDQVWEMLKGIMTEEQQKTFEEHGELDFSHEMPNIARFRVNSFHQARGMSAAFRPLALTVPSLNDMHLTAEIFQNICKLRNGLVLVTGATGSGKSTTLASIIENINTMEGKNRHILTIEDPIEYQFTSKNCLIQQREVGRDTQSFNNALRAALREDPDIIMIGEMRDLETIRLALTAAETGHLVFGTLHTSSAPSTIDRIIDVFPGNEKDMIREMLAESLRAVIAQRLLKTPDDKVHPAHEILVGNAAVRNLIREHKIPQLFSTMQTGHQFGMHTLEQNIDSLIARNAILPVDKAELRMN